MRSFCFLTQNKDTESTGVQQAYLNNNRFLKEEHNNYACKFTNSGDDMNPKNLRKWLLSDSQSKKDVFSIVIIWKNSKKLRKELFCTLTMEVVTSTSKDI